MKRRAGIFFLHAGVYALATALCMVVFSAIQYERTQLMQASRGRNLHDAKRSKLQGIVESAKKTSQMINSMRRASAFSIPSFGAATSQFSATDCHCEPLKCYACFKDVGHAHHTSAGHGEHEEEEHHEEEHHEEEAHGEEEAAHASVQGVQKLSHSESSSDHEDYATEIMFFTYIPTCCPNAYIKRIHHSEADPEVNKPCTKDEAELEAFKVHGEVKVCTHEDMEEAQAIINTLDVWVVIFCCILWMMGILVLHNWLGQFHRHGHHGHHGHDHHHDDDHESQGHGKTESS